MFKIIRSLELINIHVAPKHLLQRIAQIVLPDSCTSSKRSLKDVIKYT